MLILKAAVIGTGRIGELHAKFYKQNNDTELSFIVETNEEIGQRISKELSINWYPTLNEALSREKVDVVSVCTPEDSHLAITKELVGTNVAILMEKPLTPNIQEANELIKIVKENNIFMTVNYILRFDPRVEVLKRKIIQGDLGEHVTSFARRRGSILGAKYYGKWSDLLISTAIHDIDLMMYFNNSKVKRVYAESVRKACEPYDTDDAYVFILKFENGGVGIMETSWVLPESLPAPLETTFDYLSTKGNVKIEGVSNGLSLLTDKGVEYPDLTHWPLINEELEGDLSRAIKAFVRSVKEDSHPPVSVEEAYKSLRVVEALHDSIRQEKPIYL